MTRLWDKGTALDARVLHYTAGEDFALDERLVRYDVRASIAHAEMLHSQRLLSAQDLELIRDALTAIGEEHERGLWQIELGDEDGQTALERRLTARIGAAGGRIHLGRSRNDQVLTALRLYLRDAIAQLEAGAQAVAAALDRLAQRQGATALPGYTHMQQAMPSSVGLWAGGYAAELRDDAARHRQRAAGASRRIRSARRPAMARRGCRSIARRPRARSDSSAPRSRSPRYSSRAARPRRSCCSSWRCCCRTSGAWPPICCCSTPRNSRSSTCPMRSPPARRSCRRSATPTCSNWCGRAAPPHSPA